MARALECDDHEALLVCSWVRTGSWLAVGVRSACIALCMYSPGSLPTLCMHSLRSFLHTVVCIQCMCVMQPHSYQLIPADES